MPCQAEEDLSLLLLLLPAAAASAVHAIAAAAGEILGELQQRFMSLPPAGGLRLSWVSEAHTAEDRLGNGHKATAVDFHKIIQRKCCLNGCKFEPKVPNNHKFKHNLLFPPCSTLGRCCSCMYMVELFYRFPNLEF